MINLVVILAAAYLVGSIPAGRLVAAYHHVDITRVGSGNPGATNIWRVLGWKPALPVIITDLGKGYVATVFIAQWQWAPLPVSLSMMQILAGFCAVAGHMWSVFSGFRGGKGVLTALGMVIGLLPVAAGVCLLVWIGIFTATRIVSLGSLIASLALPAVVAIQKYIYHSVIPDGLLVFSVVICLLIWVAHHGNIRRLLAGTENRFGKSKGA